MPLEDPASKLVDYCFLNTKLFCICQDFQVGEIDLRTREIEKSYNLQEIEGFEISEELEESKVVAFTLEKDVQLLGVACEDAVHIFEYSEDEEHSLTHVMRLAMLNVKKIAFVEYILVIIQEPPGSDQVIISCSDLDSEEIKSSLTLTKPSATSLVHIQAGSGATPCLYYSMGSQIGKIEVPAMTEIFSKATGHGQDVIDFTVAANFNQIVTT